MLHALHGSLGPPVRTLGAKGHPCGACRDLNNCKALPDHAALQPGGVLLRSGTGKHRICRTDRTAGTRSSSHAS